MDYLLADQIPENEVLKMRDGRQIIEELSLFF